MGINLDLSKAFHPRFIDILWAFMPGLFFEICLLLGNTQLANSLIQPPLDHTLSIVVAVILAFIIGNIFMLWVRLLQGVLSWSFRIWYWIFPTFRRQLFEFLLRGRGNPPRQPWIGKFGFVQNAYQKALDDADTFQALMQAWRKVVKRVLQQYKIEPPAPLDHEADWLAWVGIIGKFEREDVRGYLLMVATQATGWSGIAAMRFAPMLHTRFFLVFCAFSIISGLLHDLGVAYRINDTTISWGIGLKRALEELKRLLAIEDSMENRKDNDQGA